LALYKKTYLHFNNLETAGTSGSDVNDLFGIEAVETVSLGVTDDTGKLILLVLEVNIAWKNYKLKLQICDLLRYLWKYVDKTL
jgi:hypothetical protein